MIFKVKTNKDFRRIGFIDNSDERRKLTGSPYVQVKLRSTEFNALLDTGSEYSLMSDSSWREYKASFSVGGTEIKRQGVSGESVRIRGVCYCDVQIQGIKLVDHPFYIVEGLVVPVILGVDILKRLGVIKMEFERSRLLLGKSEEIAIMKNQQDIHVKKNPKLYARACAETILQPYSEAIVKCNVAGLQCQEYLVEPLGGYDKFTRAASSVIFLTKSTKNENEVFLRMVTVNNKSETIRKGDYLASLGSSFCVMSTSSSTTPSMMNCSGP